MLCLVQNFLDYQQSEGEAMMFVPSQELRYYGRSAKDWELSVSSVVTKSEYSDASAISKMHQCVYIDICIWTDPRSHRLSTKR